MEPGYVGMGEYRVSGTPLVTGEITHCHVVGLYSGEQYGIIHADRQEYRADQVEFALNNMPEFDDALLVTSPESYGNYSGGEKEGESTIAVLREFGLEPDLLLERGVKEVTVDQNGARLSNLKRRPEDIRDEISARQRSHRRA